MGLGNIGEGGQTRQRARGRRSGRGLVNEDGERRAKPLELIAITQEGTERNASGIPDRMEKS